MTDVDLSRALEEQQQLLARLIREENRVLRESLDLLHGCVDPLDAFRDEGGWWTPLGVAASAPHRGGFSTEEELAAARDQCRALALHNEFAINGHENRISYLVGSGHTYRVVPARSAGDVSPQRLAAAQEVLDEFLRLNHWRQRQQEIVRRRDRDGECFLRFFLDHEGRTRIRFVEPWQVSSPPDRGDLSGLRMGVQSDPDDVEHVLGYWLRDRQDAVAGDFVPAADIQHRKANVDANVPRGVPLFYPVRHNLARAEKLLRNMAAVSDIQTAVALIRKHRAGTRSALEQLRSNLAAATPSGPASGQTAYFQPFRPGTILDIHADTEYDFPAKGLDASRYVVVLQAILRAVASRLVMPEFMLTADASNANYSSTLVAEGPAVKMFERLQHELREEDDAVLRRVLADAVCTGRLPSDVLHWAKIETTLPSVAVRDKLREAQIDRLLVLCGAMSPATMAQRHGLDPEQEQRRLAAITRDEHAEGP